MKTWLLFILTCVLLWLGIVPMGADTPDTCANVFLAFTIFYMVTMVIEQCVLNALKMHEKGKSKVQVQAI